MQPAARRVLKVLVVDDDDADAMMIDEALRDADADVAVDRVGDGREALDYLHRTGEHTQAPRPDLILLDLNMPRMGGQEALAQIKAEDDLKAIPVVILTTSNADADIVTSYRHQANAYVTKPMELDDFERVVAQVNRFYREIARLPAPAE
jgi:CheY-like chemotaxis protein